VVGARFTELIVDAADTDALARWWAEVLGWDVTDDEDAVIELSPPDRAGPTIVFVPVPDAKTVKNRIHIDVNPVGCTQAEEVERLLGLGATHVDIGQGSPSWVVLADPEGNEFCVLATTVPA
jgi:hypothetical protein